MAAATISASALEPWPTRCVPQHEVHAAALPGGAEKHLLDRLFQPRMRVTDHQPHATQPPRHQALQERAPKHHGLAAGDIHAQHFTDPVRTHPGGDHDRHRLHAPVLTHILVAHVQPQVWVLGLQPPAAERLDLCIKGGTQPAEFALRHHRHQRLLGPRGALTAQVHRTRTIRAPRRCQ